MNQKDKELSLTDLFARFHYGVKVMRYIVRNNEIAQLKPVQDLNIRLLELYISEQEIIIKPYLRSMSSMTEEEAKEIAILHDIKDILSVKVTSDYIEVIVDDGVCSTETRTIWFDEIILSIEIFDWLNAHHFDYRGLIPKGLALEAPENMYLEMKNNAENVKTLKV